MTNPGNWPDPERVGEPMFPERDRWHLIDNDTLFWSTVNQKYALNSFLKPCISPRRKAKSVYVGPILTPTQISEMLVAERERCVETLQKVSEGYRKNAQEIGTITAINSAEEKIEAVDDCWVKIHNLGAAP